MATLTITPASGSITATKTVCRVDVTDAPDNRPPDQTGGAFSYKIVASATGEDSLVSHVFNTSQDSKHTWNNVVFPAAGSWTLNLVDTSDDSVEGTLAVTVS